MPEELTAIAFLQSLLANPVDAEQMVTQELEGHSLLNPKIRPHGIQVSVRQAGELSIQVFEGRRSIEEGTAAIDEDTVCHIASMTKVFTSAALLKLWDNELIEGEVEWFPQGMQTPVSHFITALQEKFPDNQELHAMECFYKNGHIC